MGYPKTSDLAWLVEQVQLQSQLKHERGAKGAAAILRDVRQALRRAERDLQALPDSPVLSRREPDEYEAIVSLRPKGPRRLWTSLPRDAYLERVEGAMLARMAGCTLGAPVEFWSIERMEALAEETGQAFPPEDYWRYVPEPNELRYNMSPRKAYTRGLMRGVPVDDDIVYTLLGLLVLEEYGADFTLTQLGDAWQRYLPMACTAEEIALRNLKNGVPAEKAGETGNPYCEWIGAAIRADVWGYAAPGWPERAAELACRDALLSHRRNGVYGEMFFAAAIAAAFAVDDPVEALRVGLSEIPAQCSLAKAVRWALKVAPEIRDYRSARDAMDERFRGMHPVHTINNACLTVWGVTIGGTDVTRVLSKTVAMGMDNDCTAATAGSIVGAVVGKQGVPKHWYRPFGNTVWSYLNGKKRFSITGLVRRFAKQARAIHAGFGRKPSLKAR